MGWVITLGILILLAIVPVGIHAAYNTGGAVIRLIIGPFRFTLKRKGGGRRSNKKHGASEENFESQKTAKKKQTGKLSDFLPLLQTVLSFLTDFKKKLRIDNLEMKLILAGDDPCDLAVNYGRAWAVLGNLMPQLERLFVIKKRNLEVACDFTSNETRIDVHADLTLTVWRLLTIGVFHGIRMLRKYLKLLNKLKAVQ